MKTFQFMRNSLIRRSVQCSLLLLGPISAQSGDAMASERQTLVVPLNNATTPGEGAQNAFPAAGARFLSIYNPSQFIAAMPEGGMIDQIAFRLDETIRGRSVSFDLEAEVRMSTSTSLATRIPSLRFSDNVGVDQTIVFPRQNIRWTTKAAIAGANPFDLVVTFTSSFFYDPRRGSLAIDLWTYREPIGPSAIDTGGPDDFGITATSLSGVQNLNEGRFLDAPIIQVRYSAIPEPSTLSLGILGLLILAKGSRR